MSFCLIILAAGNSSRFKSNLPKPYLKIGGKSLIEINVNKARKVKDIKKIVIVINSKHKKHFRKLKLKNVLVLTGGKTRQESTFNALKYLNNNQKIKNVLIHDAARPNYSSKLLHSLIKNIKKSKAVIPKIKINDAIKQIFDSSNFEYITSRDRENTFLTQTPQCFKFKDIFELHKKNGKKYHDDDISLFEDINDVKFVEGNKENFKITSLEDFEFLKKIYKSKMFLGIGFDVHRLVPNKKLYLGGLKVKSKFGTLGHSDGDPVLHSITDAILGACKMGDIGQMFSDKKKEFKNIRSTILLNSVIKKIKNEGYFINNIDINIITQKPKIKNLKKKMIKNIAELCEISINQINFKYVSLFSLFTFF